MKRLFTNLRGPTGTAVDILVCDGMFTAMDTNLTTQYLDVDVEQNPRNSRRNAATN